MIGLALALVVTLALNLVIAWVGDRLERRRRTRWRDLRHLRGRR